MDGEGSHQACDACADAQRHTGHGHKGLVAFAAGALLGPTPAEIRLKGGQPHMPRRVHRARRRRGPRSIRAHDRRLVGEPLPGRLRCVRVPKRRPNWSSTSHRYGTRHGPIPEWVSLAIDRGFVVPRPDRRTVAEDSRSPRECRVIPRLASVGSRSGTSESDRPILSPPGLVRRHLVVHRGDPERVPVRSHSDHRALEQLTRSGTGRSAYVVERPPRAPRTVCR